MKKSHKQVLLWVFGLLVTVAVICVVSKMGLQYLDKLIFTERQTQLQEVVGQYYREIDLVTENSWNTAYDMKQRFEREDFTTVQQVQNFFESEIKLQERSSDAIRPIAIRVDGQYIDDEGAHGDIGYTEPLNDCTERTNYIYEQPYTGNLFNLYVYRLDSPVTVSEGENQYQVEFVGITRPMSSMNQYFRCTAYGGENSTYILDRYGSKQYVDASNTMNLIEGHNVYTVLQREYEAEGRNFNEILADLNEKGVVYSDININGEQCFFSIRKMPDSDYTIAYVNQASRIATSTQKLLNLVITAIILAALIVLAIIIIGAVCLVVRNQKQLAEEMRAKQELQSMNGKLEQVNRDLEEAQETTKAALQTAESASRAKSEFLSNMSHDIRTPMNAIVGIVGLMDHEGDLTDKQHTYIQKIQMSSKHLLSLINDVLDMSKIESSEMVLNQEPISLAEQVGQIESIVRSQTNERGQEFTVRVHELSHEYLVGDAVRLRQVFLNLLSNAVKYTPNGGKVLLDIAELPCEAEDKATIRISVTDTGCGMTPEFIERIFEPFTRMENSVTNKVQGTGLGMAITKSIVDTAGGTIEVHSEVEKGSRFDVTLTFPIDHSVERVVNARGVLLVADEETLVRNMKVCMTQTQVMFQSVSTVAEAVKLLGEHPFDVILLAGYLHDQTLDETVRLLRETAGGTALIFSCDYAEREKVIDELLKSGADGLISRPFFLSNLISAIDHTQENASVEENQSILHGMRFLCAEDNDLNAEILDAILEVNGASCEIYPDGAKLVEAFKSVKPGDYNAILMDVQMPNMNGLEATRFIRQGKNPLGKTIPIIAMTANAFAEDVQSCLDAGMDAHVSKPLDITALERALRNTGAFS